MECFVIIVNGWKPLFIITKHSILDVAAALDPPLVCKIISPYVNNQRLSLLTMSVLVAPEKLITSASFDFDSPRLSTLFRIELPMTITSFDLPSLLDFSLEASS